MTPALIRFLLSFCFFGCAAAWWGAGHRLVTQIAELQLNQTEKALLTKVANEFVEYFPQNPTAVSLGTWMDDIQGWNDNPNTLYAFFPWHFRNIIYNPEHIGDDLLPKPMSYQHVDIVWALSQLLPAMRPKASGAFFQAFILRCVSHMVGDLHQPMHSISRFDNETRWTKSNPAGDRGGNGCKLAGVEWNNATDRTPNPYWTSSLHAVWDSCGGQYAYDPSSPPTTADNQQTLNDAQDLLTLHPCSSFTPQELAINVNMSAKYMDSEWFKVVRRWGEEAYQLAIEYGYVNNTIDCDAGTDVPASFVPGVQKICKRQIALGGCRLGELYKRVLPQNFTSVREQILAEGGNNALAPGGADYPDGPCDNRTRLVPEKVYDGFLHADSQAMAVAAIALVGVLGALLGCAACFALVRFAPARTLATLRGKNEYSRVPVSGLKSFVDDEF